MQDVIEGKDYSFPRQEEHVLKFWEEKDAFKQQLKRSEGKKPYVFYDGPPFATGLPHYGHLLAGTLKVQCVSRHDCVGQNCPTVATSQTPAQRSGCCATGHIAPASSLVTLFLSMLLGLPVDCTQIQLTIGLHAAHSGSLQVQCVQCWTLRTRHRQNDDTVFVPI